MRHGFEQAAPAFEVGEQSGERAARGGPELVGPDQAPGGLVERHPGGARGFVQGAQGGGAEAALGLVDDALECQVVARAVDRPQVGQRVADL